MDEKQDEVWETVLTYTDLIIKGKADEFLQYIHEDYTGWNDIEPMPVDKNSIIRELNSESLNKPANNYNLVPIKIKILHDVAVVHYSLTFLQDSNSDSEVLPTKHYTDVLLKNKSGWVLIADHFGIQKRIIAI